MKWHVGVVRLPSESRPVMFSISGAEREGVETLASHDEGGAKVNLTAKEAVALGLGLIEAGARAGRLANEGELFGLASQ